MKSKPLYVNDGKCIEPQLPLRMQALGAFKSALEDGTLKFIENKCLCHNEHPKNDIIISEKDRYGIAIPQVICSKCGLIRSRKVLTRHPIVYSTKNIIEKYICPQGKNLQKPSLKMKVKEEKLF